MAIKNKSLLLEINKYINNDKDDIYSVINEIKFENFDFALEKLKELSNEQQGNERFSKLSNVLQSFDKKDFLDKTSNNRLSNHIRLNKIEKALTNVIEDPTSESNKMLIKNRK